jgi:hypothetical protein
MGNQAPDTLLRLVERFDRQRDAYAFSQYNEAQLREEFLNPFFEAMGWDIYNREGLSETCKPVIRPVLLTAAC